MATAKLLKNFALRLKELRTTRRWTQDDLAERAGLSSDAIRRMETAIMSPTLTTLHKLSVGFGIELGTLLEGIGARRRQPRSLPQLVDFMSTHGEREAATLIRVAHALWPSSPER